MNYLVDDKLFPVNIYSIIENIFCFIGYNMLYCISHPHITIHTHSSPFISIHHHSPALIISSNSYIITTYDITKYDITTNNCCSLLAHLFSQRQLCAPLDAAPRRQGLEERRGLGLYGRSPLGEAVYLHLSICRFILVGGFNPCEKY